MIETRFDVAFDDPGHTRPSFAEFLQSRMTAPVGSETMAGFQEVGPVRAIVDRFEDQE